jgi:hypothetical protein
MAASTVKAADSPGASSTGSAVSPDPTTTSFIRIS